MNPMARESVSFETDVGTVVLYYRGNGVTGVALLPTALCQLSTGTVPPWNGPSWVVALAGRIRRHAAGEPQDFSDVPILHDSTSAFAVKVYEELRKVPAGSTVSYSELAARVGSPSGARAVARAMATNRWPILVPCHRVLGSNTRLGGYSGGDGLATKCALLRAESVPVCLPKGAGISGSLFRPYMFNLAVDSLRANDRLFRKLRDSTESAMLPHEHPGNPFAALVEAVCYQQLAGSAAAAIFRKVCRVLTPHPSPLTPSSVLRAGVAGLRSGGLSSSKAATILELAARAASGRIDFDKLSTLDYPTLEETLRSVKGIGPWTVHMFAIFHLGLPDIFPPGDFGIRKAVSLLLGAKDILSPKEAESIGERWKPLRTVATWYLWRSLGTVTLGT